MMARMRRQRIISLMACYCISGFIWRVAHAGEIQGVRELGMAGALRALPSGSSAIYLNPAGMSLGPTYEVQGIYQYLSSDTSSRGSITIVDSATLNVVAAGIFYNYQYSSPIFDLPGKEGGHEVGLPSHDHDFGLALSMPLGQRVFVGLIGRYIMRWGEGQGNPPKGRLDLDTEIGGFTMSIGGIVMLGHGFTVAVTGNNLIPIENTLNRRYPQTLALAANYQLDQILLAGLDLVMDFSSSPSEVVVAYGAGIEGRFYRHYAIRGGISYDHDEEALRLSVGLGYRSEKFGANLAFRNKATGGSESLIAVSITLYIQ